VGDSSAIRWAALKDETGSVRPRPQRGGSRSPLDAHTPWLLALIAKEPGLTLEATVERIEHELGLKTTDSSVSRFFLRHAISFKKNAARGRAGPAGRGRRPG
jgi:transposase